MDAAAAEITICALITDARSRLDQAAAIAKAAESCAESDNPVHAVQILTDFEGLAHDAQDLFKAALMIRRHLLADQA